MKLIYGDRYQSCDCVRGMGITWEDEGKNFLEWWKYITWLRWWLTWECTVIKIHRIVHLKIVRFTVCKFHIHFLKHQIKLSCGASGCKLWSTEGAPSSPNTLWSPSYFGMQIRPPRVSSVSKVNLPAPQYSLSTPLLPHPRLTGSCISPGHTLIFGRWAVRS